MKLPFSFKFWQKKHDPPADPFPIVFEWQGKGTPFTPYARIRKINPAHHDWDRLVSRRSKLLYIRDKHFLPKPIERWDDVDKELAAVWGELLQLPTHVVEMGFHRGSQRHRFFRDGFNFALLPFFDADYVAKEVGRFAVIMFLKLDSPKAQNPGTLADLRDDWHQQYVLANILAAYRHLRSL